MAMGKKAEIAELRKQVEALQAEVATLKAVPSWPQPVIGGGIYVGDVPPYGGFVPPYGGFVTTCGGADPARSTVASNVAAGCAPVSTYWASIGA
jgi:hypothetical protein